MTTDVIHHFNDGIHAMSVSDSFGRLVVCSIIAFLFTVYMDTVWPGTESVSITT